MGQVAVVVEPLTPVVVETMKWGLRTQEVAEVEEEGTLMNLALPVVQASLSFATVEQVFRR